MLLMPPVTTELLQQRNPLSAFIPGPSDFFFTGSSSLSSQSASVPPIENDKWNSESYTYRSVGVNAFQGRKCHGYWAVVTGSSHTSITENTFPFLKGSSEGTTLSAKVLMDDHPSLVIRSGIFLLARLLSKIICWCKPRQFRSLTASTLSSITFHWPTVQLVSSAPAKGDLITALIFPCLWPSKPERIEWDLWVEMKQQSWFETTTCFYLGL